MYVKIISNKLSTAILILGLLLACLPAHAITILDETIASVNGNLIMRSQLEERIKTISPKEKAELGSADNIRKKAMEELILETIQLQMGERFGLEIGEQQLDQAVERFAKSSNRSVAQLKQDVIKQGISFESFREKMRNQIIMNEVQRAKLSSKLQVSEQEVDNLLQSTHGQNISLTKYRILNILLPAPKTAANKNFMASLRNSLMRGEVSLKAVIEKQRFDDRALNVNDMGWSNKNNLPSSIYNAVQSMKVRDISAPVAVGDGYSVLLLIDKQGHKAVMVDQYNARHILIKTNTVRSDRAASELANTILIRLKNGEDFDSLVKLYSDDEGSAVNGGNLGWATADTYVPAFADALKTAKVNEYTKVVKSQFGYHVIQLLGKRSHDASQDMLRNKARDMIFQKKLDESLDTWLQKIRSEAHIEYKVSGLQ